jgi:redox-sensitive bicupin YhaK (pirin superfamily)
VVHSEHPLDTVQHGIQLWTSLPRAMKTMAPRYQRIDADSIPKVVHDSTTVAVIAGEFAGTRGPAETLMPLFLWHARLAPGARLVAPVDAAFEAAAYVVDGEASLDADGTRTLHPGQLAVWREGEGTLFIANRGAKPLDALVLGGAPAEGPLVFHGPFVMNSVEQIRAAEIAYRTGRMGTLG